MGGDLGETGRAYFKEFQVVGHIGGEKIEAPRGWTLGRPKF